MDPPVDHDGHGIGHLGCNADILLDDEDRDIALRGEPHQRFLDMRDDDRGEALGRFVHDEQARIHQERPADRQHLLFAAGKLAAAIAPSLGKAREQLVDAFRRPIAFARRHQVQMLVHRQRSPQAAPLWHIADPHPRDLCRRAPDEFLAHEADRSGRDPDKPHDRLAHRGLAHAVPPDDGEDAGMKRKIDPLQGMASSVEDIHALQLEDWARTNPSGGEDVQSCPPPR